MWRRESGRHARFCGPCWPHSSFIVRSRTRLLSPAASFRHQCRSKKTSRSNLRLSILRRRRRPFRKIQCSWRRTNRNNPSNNQRKKHLNRMPTQLARASFRLRARCRCRRRKAKTDRQPTWKRTNTRWQTRARSRNRARRLRKHQVLPSRQRLNPLRFRRRINSRC